MTMPIFTTSNTRQRGFTLVEIIVVLVITSIVAVMVSTFIRLPFITYADIVMRAEMTDVADTALRRVARDVRLALPNSVRVSGDGAYLELLLTKTGGRYLDESDGVAGNYLQFERPGLDCSLTPLDAGCSFDVLGNMPSAPQNIVVGDKLVVYNLGPDMTPGDAYAGGNITTINSVVGNRLGLANQVFAQQAPALRSPTRRFQIVTTPVTFQCIASNNGTGKLWRYSGYPISNSQATPPTSGQAVLLADGVTDCSFDYASLANVHSALIGLRIGLQRTNKSVSTPENISLFHQVHVDNTP